MSSSSIIPQRSGITYHPTVAGYNIWSSTYDTDGNALTALDDLMLETRLPQWLEGVLKNWRASRNEGLIQRSEPVRILDLGCGTGRNTLKVASLLADSLEVNRNETGVIVGVDASEKMLSVAVGKCNAFLKNYKKDNVSCTFGIYNIPFVGDAPLEIQQAGFDAILSTLVIEHIPADIYFETAAQLLKHHGTLLLTNMHPEMGFLSQAGFIDAETGEKNQMISYCHQLEDVQECASEFGLKIVDGQRLEEKAIDEQMIADGYISERGRKWAGVKCWMGGVWVKDKA